MRPCPSTFPVQRTNHTKLADEMYDLKASWTNGTRDDDKIWPTVLWSSSVGPVKPVLTVQPFFFFFLVVLCL